MYKQGPYAHRWNKPVDLNGPFTVAREAIKVVPEGRTDVVKVPVGAQLPNWRTLGIPEPQLMNMYRMGFLEQRVGDAWEVPPDPSKPAANAARPPAKPPVVNSKGPAARR